MKKLKTGMLVLSLMYCAVQFISCGKNYNYVPEPVSITTPVSFSGDIMPIFNASCNMASCHLPGGPSPDLSAANAYDQLHTKAQLDLANPASSKLYVRMAATTNPMPPFGKLPANELSKILTWIQQGANKN